jgi:FSR family fosmidomycin resistance protein-like MFS transporter
MARGFRPLYWAVCFGHTTVDMLVSTGPVLMAFLASHILPMSNTQIGFAISAAQLMGALSQPFAGYIADKTGGRWLGAGGVVWVGFFLTLALIFSTTGIYALMVIPYVIASLGSGLFHPVGTMYAASEDKSRLARNLSIFFLMGQLGSGVGPVLMGALLDSAATHNGIFTSALGPHLNGLLLEQGTIAPVLSFGLITLPIFLFMFLQIPNASAHAETRRASSSSADGGKVAVGALAFLALVVMLRSLANPGIVAFLPRLFQLKGWSAAEYGLITSLYWVSSGLAGVVCGNLADRYGSRTVIAVSLLLGAPMLLFLPLVDGVVALVLAVAAGALTGGSHSVIVAMTQRLMPARKGLAGGLTLGFIFGTGAIGTLVIGGLSDRVGLMSAFQIVAGVTAITALMAWRLPSDRHAQAPAEAAAPQSEVRATGRAA